MAIGTRFTPLCIWIKLDTDKVGIDFLECWKHKPVVWICYANDNLFIWTHGQSNIEQFFKETIKTHRNLKFTHESVSYIKYLIFTFIFLSNDWFLRLSFIFLSFCLFVRRSTVLDNVIKAQKPGEILFFLL